MFNAKFDFDAAFDRAAQIVASVCSEPNDGLQRALVLREAAVVRLANAPFWSDAWHKACEDVAVLDAELAEWGLA